VIIVERKTSNLQHSTTNDRTSWSALDVGR
jgi:hypothetical protein